MPESSHIPYNFLQVEIIYNLFTGWMKFIFSGLHEKTPIGSGIKGWSLEIIELNTDLEGEFLQIFSPIKECQASICRR
ncbi:MAG: hypothetical protein H7A25_13130 [Leptospiraceae bacterium]|nr:hypothetical protein [Leptospiraceae bacterium]MCP5500844.1 hypothetical protein [Leptospiraceae bacterium]